MVITMVITMFITMVITMAITMFITMVITMVVTMVIAQPAQPARLGQAKMPGRPKTISLIVPTNFFC